MMKVEGYFRVIFSDGKTPKYLEVSTTLSVRRIYLHVMTAYIVLYSLEKQMVPPTPPRI